MDELGYRAGGSQSQWQVWRAYLPRTSTKGMDVIRSIRANTNDPLNEVNALGKGSRFEGSHATSRVSLCV